MVTYRGYCDLTALNFEITIKESKLMFLYCQIKFTYNGRDSSSIEENQEIVKCVTEKAGDT